MPLLNLISQDMRRAEGAKDAAGRGSQAVATGVDGEADAVIQIQRAAKRCVGVTTVA